MRSGSECAPVTRSESYELQTVNSLPRPIQVLLQVPIVHPSGHYTTFKQLWSNALNGQDVWVDHPLGYDDLFTISLDSVPCQNLSGGW